MPAYTLTPMIKTHNEENHLFPSDDIDFVALTYSRFIYY